MDPSVLRVFTEDLLQNYKKPPFLRGVGGINPEFCKRSRLFSESACVGRLRPYSPTLQGAGPLEGEIWLILAGANLMG